MRRRVVFWRVVGSIALVAWSALEAVPAKAQCTVYVPTHKSNSVAVVDTGLDRVVTVIPVEIQPLAVAITPDRSFAYVTNSGWMFGSNSVSVTAASQSSANADATSRSNALTFAMPPMPRARCTGSRCAKLPNFKATELGERPILSAMAMTRALPRCMLPNGISQ